MFRRKFIAALMSVLCIAAAIPSVPTFADGQKVVTLGADLSEDQRQAILRYFGVAGQNLLTLTITNQDERAHLGSYVPLEQIGTRTYSCALVNPTNSGGIQVKTANLTWVTSNMIATTLSTSGVVNCEVLAAAPFEVSGTGALTGILMAYESAVGTQLDTAKKEVATQELITTTTIANNIGQVQATDIVNESKKEVIQGDVISDNDIDIIINEVAEEENISLSEEDRELLRELLLQIAQQDYEYEDMKTTLERVEQNMNDLMEQQANQAASDTPEQTEIPQTEQPATEQPEETETPETLPEDSILNGTDDSALGDSTVFDATDTSALPQTEAAETEDPLGFEISSSDSYSDDSEGQVPETTPAAPDTQIEIPADQMTDPGLQPETPAPEQPSDDEYAINDMLPEDNTEIVSSDELPELAGDEGLVTPMLEAITQDMMVFAPSAADESETVPAGLRELTISFQKNNITAGTGAVTLWRTADGSMVEAVTTGDPSKVTVEPLDEEELLTLGWSEGSKATISLAAPLDASAAYYVTLDENAFITEDGIGYSVAVADPAAWKIQTAAYGCDMDLANVTAGSVVTGQVTLDGAAATYAVIENADPAFVTFDLAEFSESGSFNATFSAPGKTSFQMTFYGPDGWAVGSADYTVEVQ